MNMKKNIIKIILCVLAVVLLVSCDPSSEKVTEIYKVVSFDDLPDSMVASDVYGDNLYEAGYYWLDEKTGLGGGIVGDKFWNGGSAITKYPSVVLEASDYDNWYKKQMSTYPSPTYAGYNSSRALIATGVMYHPTFNFTDSPTTERVIESLLIANTSYAYYQMTTDVGAGVPITQENEGWFKVKFIGYKASGAKSGEVEAYLADFRPRSLDRFGVLTSWNAVYLSSLGAVHKIEIVFEGSDVGAWGLNTPAYVAIDQIVVKLNKGEEVAAKAENIEVEKII